MYRNLARYASTAAHSAINRDIVIVGGGIVGLALAKALTHNLIISQTASISLIEGSDLKALRDWKPKSPKHFSNRVSSITSQSQHFLQSIDAWSHVDTTRVRELEEIQVTDGLSPARLVFNSADMDPQYSAAPMAFMTENLNLQSGLLKSLQNTSLDVQDNAKVVSIQADDANWPVVQLDNGKSLRARLLIGADGFNSPVKKYSNIDSYGWAYDTHAVVATLDHQPSIYTNGTTAFQRFLPTGPIAFLPVSETAASMVWSTKPAIAKALKSHTSEAIAAMVNAAFRLPFSSLEYLHDRLVDPESPITSAELIQEIAWRSSTAVTTSTADSSPYDYPPEVTGIQEGTIAGFPLKMSHADTYLGEPIDGKASRTALLGDAAHTVHPLAGQGLNLGLMDAQALTSVIATAARDGQDIGSLTALRSYPRQRYTQNHAILSACDKLHKLYSVQSKPVVWARHIGLDTVNELPALKAAFMGTAGASGDFKMPSMGNVMASATQAVFTASNIARFAGGLLLSRITKLK